MYGHKNREAWRLAVQLDNTYWDVVDEVCETYETTEEQARALKNHLPDEIDGVRVTIEKLKEYLTE